jgi:hypothetical protein
VDTYTEFAESNKEVLQSMPAPAVAKDYYEAADLYTFDEFQTARERGTRRPKIDTLYDVMCSIRDDEAEHVKTMAACQDREVLRRAPGTEKAVAATLLSALAAAYIAGNAPAEWGTTVANVLSKVAESTESALQSARNAMAEAMGSAVNEGGAEQLEGAVEESAPTLLDTVVRLLSRLRG